MTAARTALRLCPLLICALCVLQASSSSSAATEGPSTTRSPPAAVIELDELHITVDAAGNASGVVTGNGTIVNSARSPSGRPDHTLVELEAVSANGWPVSIDPAVIDFPPDGGPRRFSWAITVPMNTTANLTDTVTFSGSVTIFPPGTRSARIPERTVTVDVMARNVTDGEGGGGAGGSTDHGVDHGDATPRGTGGRSYAASAVVLAILLLPFIVSHAAARRRRAPGGKGRERRVGRGGK